MAFLQFGDFDAGEVERLLEGKVPKIPLSNKKEAKIPYTNESTSLGCTPSIQRGVESSTIPCGSEEASGLLLYALRDCRGPCVVEVLFIDGCSLIVERVGPGVEITMKEEHARWSVNHTWDQSLVTESWWERKFEDGMKIDLRDLHYLMVYSLTLANSENVPNAQYFEEQRIGKDVLNFLHRLNTLVHFEKVYVLWALDHPVFWTPALKTNFILKLWERMSGVRTLPSASLDRYLRSIYDVFPKYLTMDTYVIKVKEFCETNNEGHSRKTYTKVSKSDSFEIVRIYRGCLYHYNRYLDEGQKERISSNEISTIADTMLKVGVCTELINAVGYAWSISKDDGM
ncbi:hypothetical protein RHGRI_026894 [Rhododendron griersonianum]|uniref:Uncharacterized protein n=1 Tax=Rhododendron griersonianum TaxID=479676 RepID=A0AAV6J005_9ERIC|nr:hypothetical protein RHGRI_026894 [Rhododendron griersonianum]